MARPVIVKTPALMRHKHSIVDVANVIKSTDERWILDGIQFPSMGCNGIFAHQRNCWIEGSDDKGIQDCYSMVVVDAYTMEITVQWPTNDKPSQAEELIKEAVDVGGASIIERVLQKGVDAGAGTLQDFIPFAFTGTISTTAIPGYETGPDPMTFDVIAVSVGTNADANARLGLVEAKLVDGSDHIGGAGTVYMGPQSAVQLTATGCIYEEGGKLYTLATGSQIVIGNFSGLTIYGHPGDVDLYLGPANFTDTVEHGTNTYIAQVEQSFAVARSACGLVKATAA